MPGGRSRNNLLEYVMVALHSPVIIGATFGLKQSPFNGYAEAVAACNRSANTESEKPTLLQEYGQRSPKLSGKMQSAEMVIQHHA